MVCTGSRWCLRRSWSRTLAALAPVLLERHTKEPGLLPRVIPLIKERLHTLAEAADYLPMFYTSDFSLTREALVPKKQTPEGAATALKEMRAIIEATPDQVTGIVVAPSPHPGRARRRDGAA